MRGLGDLVRRVHLKDVRAKVGDCPPGLGASTSPRRRVRSTRSATRAGSCSTPPGPPALVGATSPSRARSCPARLVAAVAAAWRLRARDLRLGRGDRGLPALRPRRGPLGGDLVEQCFDHPERAAALEQAGIAIAGIAGYRNLIDPDERERRENIEYLARCLELAPRIGTSVVATEAGTRSTEGQYRWHPDNRLPASVQLFHDAVGELLETAERHGSILALEGSVRHVLAPTRRSTACSTASPRATSRSCSTCTTTSRARCCRRSSA